MMRLFDHQIGVVLGTLLRDADPWAVYIVAIYGSIFALFGTHPLRVTDEKKFHQLALIHLRQFLLTSFVLIFCVVFFITYLISHRFYGDWEYWNVFSQTVLYALSDSWPIIPLCWSISWLSAFTWHRQITPYISNVMRRYRIRQSGDELSDIRVEQRSLASKNFDPQKFYKDGWMFLGLDGKGEPIYEKDADFCSRNMKTIGPTQTGKGVAMGVIIDQAVRKGWTVFFVNPKPDRFIPNIMREACEAAGRRAPVQVDLNGVGAGKYGPFIAGTPRQRRERLLYAAGLNDDGGQADFYKAGERSIVDKILGKWDGSISHLNTLLHPRSSGDVDEAENAGEIFNKTTRLRSYLSEWLAHPPLDVGPNRGFSIARTIAENGVAHIVSHTREKLVKTMTTVLLIDLIQSIEALGNQPRKHILVVVDEVKFMISDTLAAGLATVLDKGCNMIVAYQTVNDLLALEDKKLNARAISQAVDVNCKYTLCYRAVDAETAEWAAQRSGSVQKKVAAMEKVVQNRMGAEHWENERTMRNQEEYLLPENTFLSLPDRVAGFYRPNGLAQLMYTCWVPVKSMLEPVETKQKAAAPAPSERPAKPASQAHKSERIEPTINESAADPASNAEPSPDPEPDIEAQKAKLRESLKKITDPKPKKPRKPTIDANAALDELLTQAHIAPAAKPAAEDPPAPADARSDVDAPSIGRDDVDRLNEDLSKL